METTDAHRLLILKWVGELKRATEMASIARAVLADLTLSIGGENAVLDISNLEDPQIKIQDE